MAQLILIIEDELHVSNYLEEIFQDNGFETLTAKNGDEALELLKDHSPDLITLDLQMPEKHGTRFYQQFRKDEGAGNIPVVVISGQSSPHRSIKADKVAAFVNKPFDPAELVRVVKGAMP